MKSVTAKEAKNRFGQLIDDAQRGPVTISKNGRPFAVVLSYEDFQMAEELKLTSLRHAIDEGRAEYAAGREMAFDKAAVEKINAAGRRRSSERDLADTLIARNRKRILELARRRGIRNVRVFGSRSRGDAAPTSDVDLLVELEEGRTGLALGGFLMDVSELLGRRVDVVTENALHPQIRDRVLKEAVAL